MRINDLQWTPDRVGTGFRAMHQFANGITVHVRCCAITPEGEQYEASVYGRDGRLDSRWNGLDRGRLESRLNWTAMRPCL